MEKSWLQQELDDARREAADDLEGRYGYPGGREPAGDDEAQFARSGRHGYRADVKGRRR